MSVKRLKFEHRPGQLGFIYDSMLKFLVENNHVQTYLIQNNYENNILLHRGTRTRDVYENSLEKLENCSMSCVDKVIPCFGTNNILNMQYKNSDLTHVIMEISYAVSDIQKFCVERDIT